MEKYNLIEKDFNIIRKLLIISKVIGFQYDKMMSLEMSDMKESNDYQSAMEVLNSLLIGEKNLYAFIGNDGERIQAFMEYFSSTNNLNNFFEEIKTMVGGDISELIKKRIIIRLLDIKIEIDQQKLNDFGKEIERETKELNLTIAKPNSYFALANLLELTKILKQDFLNSLLTLSNETSFVAIKYSAAFLYKECENRLIKNGFNANCKLCWVSQITVDMKGINQSTFEEAKENFGYNLILQIIKYLNNKPGNQDLWNLLIRVALLFCSHEDRSKLKKQFNIAEDILEKNLNDKNVLLVLSLKGKDNYGTI
ncbi:MAG: hypothetical protein E7161_00810 [Firmicutes bacterium]|nr:hypothetical protein [Bacillota bacterium]